MAEDYTADELITRIKAIDTEIELHLMSTVSGGPAKRSPLDYRLGDKTVDITSRIKLLQSQRKVYTDELTMVAGGTSEKVTPSDYEMNDLGEQLGDVIKGNE